MPTPRKAGRFGGSAAHHKHIVANLATELIRHGRIRTTHAKAKTVQPTAERLITYAKRGDLHSRRQARKIVRDGDVLHHLFAEVGPAFADRDGGYTRVLKLGPRKGDAAQMALIELVAEVSLAGEDGAEAESRRRWTLRRRGTAAPEAGDAEPEEAEEPAAEEPTAVAEPEDEEERPEADPAEVEARLAAEEAEEPETQESETQKSDDPEAAGAESPETEAAEESEADADSGDEVSGDEDEDQGRS